MEKIPPTPLYKGGLFVAPADWKTVSYVLPSRFESG